MKPKRYPYSGKIRVLEKTILSGSYINASNIKSNNSRLVFNGEKIVISGENVRLNEGWSNEQRKDLCSL